MITDMNFYHVFLRIYHTVPFVLPRFVTAPPYQDNRGALQTRSYKSAGLSFCAVGTEFLSLT